MNFSVNLIAKNYFKLKIPLFLKVKIPCKLSQDLLGIFPPFATLSHTNTDD